MRQSPAGEGDDDCVVRAKEEVDEEDLQQEKEPTGGVDHVCRSKGPNPSDWGSLVRARDEASIYSLKVSGRPAMAPEDRT